MKSLLSHTRGVVMLDNGATEDSVQEVLDYFQAKCREVVPRLDSSWIGVTPTAKQDNTSMGIALWNGVFRIQTKNKGVVACLDMGTKTISTGDLIARVRTFLATGEISVIGDMRCTMVTKGQYKTVFVNLWTEGPINIKEMFPQSGDAPGRDFPGVPRPTGLRRALSVLR